MTCLSNKNEINHYDHKQGWWTSLVWRRQASEDGSGARQLKTCLLGCKIVPHQEMKAEMDRPKTLEFTAHFYFRR